LPWQICHGKSRKNLAMAILICHGKLFAIAKCRNAMAKHTLPWQMQTFNAFFQKSIKDRKTKHINF
jgi:hypothetical protein